MGNAHFAKGLHSFSLLRWLLRRQTEGVFKSLSEATHDSQSSTDPGSGTYGRESPQMSSMRDRDGLSLEAATSELEGGLPTRDLCDSNDLFAHVPHLSTGTSRISSRTGHIAVLRTSLEALTDRMVAGISGLIPCMVRSLHRSRTVTFRIPLITTTNQSLQAAFGECNLPSSTAGC